MKIGDVVKLKSGGVRMTVNDMYDGVVYCKWFDCNGNVCEHYFSIEAVVIFTEEDK